jgi:hypothetical protein
MLRVLAQWILGWVAPEPVWTMCKRKKSFPYFDLNDKPAAIQPVGSRYTSCGVPSFLK